MVSGHGHFSDLKPAVKIDFTTLRHDTETETKREKVIAAEAAEDARHSADQQTTNGIDSAGVVRRDADIRLDGHRHGISVGSDRDVIPLVRINPEYPQRARDRAASRVGCRCEFTITPAGTVADAKVVDADPKGLFEKAALDAIARWKYNPKVVDGRAMERRGVGVVLTFKLEK